MIPTTTYDSVATVLIDFDSVICGVESMDLLFEALLEAEPESVRNATLSRVRAITNRGMSGEIPFSESLSLRLAALPQKPVDFAPIVERVRAQLSPSFLSVSQSWRLDRVHVLSSGFRQLIQPALEPLGIAPERIYCNRLTLNDRRIITGVAPGNPLAGDHGKVRRVEELSPPREIVIVGDGITDWQVAEAGAADYFFCYVEFVRREPVLAYADEVVSSFDQLTELLRLTER